MNDTVLKELLTTADRGIRKREDRLIASVERQALSSIAERRMDALCRQMTGDRYHAVYGKVRVLLIAAIVAGLLMATAAGAVWYRAVVRYDEKRGENVYHVEGGRVDRLPADLRPAFIPDRFAETVSQTRNTDGYQLVLRARDGSVLAVTARPAGEDQLFDASRGDNDWIELDGISYFRRRTVTETEPARYANMLVWADDRIVVTACVWQTDGYNADTELAAVIRSVPAVPGKERQG